MARPRIRKCVFPVAGLGTRFLPATKAMPKEMLTLVDRPLIQHAVDEAKAAGIEQFIFVTSRGKGSLEDHFDRHDDLRRSLEARGKHAELKILDETDIESGQLLFTRQREPLGLGHAVWCARHLVGHEPFAVILADMVLLSEQGALGQMMGAYEQLGGNIIAVNEVPHERTKSYGIVAGDNLDQRVFPLNALVEKPEPARAPSNLAITGRYILQPEVFRYLDEKQAGAGGEIQLTDSLVKLLSHQPFYGCRLSGQVYDCGDKTGFIEANVAFALKGDNGRAIRDALRKIVG
ncbi:MAG: UTP--glucose-1-phosphate uridylyltransferase [Alphaproteobacteria bacterium]|nr:UTP--glucose-1-phosphate uridylyltransferase [Alphaproteobacteria bacterium]